MAVESALVATMAREEVSRKNSQSVLWCETGVPARAGVGPGAERRGTRQRIGCGARGVSSRHPAIRPAYRDRVLVLTKASHCLNMTLGISRVSPLHDTPEIFAALEAAPVVLPSPGAHPGPRTRAGRAAGTARREDRP